MAKFTKKPSAPTIFVAKEAFTFGGATLVPQGATAAAGHPILKGREHLFDPWQPTFGTIAGAPAEADADEPAEPAEDGDA